MINLENRKNASPPPPLFRVSYVGQAWGAAPPLNNQFFSNIPPPPLKPMPPMGHPPLQKEAPHLKNNTPPIET